MLFIVQRIEGKEVPTSVGRQVSEEIKSGARVGHLFLPCGGELTFPKVVNFRKGGKRRHSNPYQLFRPNHVPVNFQNEQVHACREIFHGKTACRSGHVKNLNQPAVAVKNARLDGCAVRQ